MAPEILSDTPPGYPLPAALLPKVRSTLQQLSDSNIIGITYSRKDGRSIAANEEFLRIVGFDRQDL